MAFDIAEGKARIQAVVNDPRSVRPGMNTLLEYCARVYESPAWKKISSLPFEKEVLTLQRWLQKTLTNQPPSDNIRAFWFGLQKVTLNNGETSCGLYISGSTRFDADDITAGWASLDDSSYLPKGNQAKSAILHEMFHLVHKYEVGEIGKYVLCLGYACLAVKAACSEADRMLLLGQYEPRPVAVGFDDGDFIFINF